MGYSKEYFKDLGYTLEGFSFEDFRGRSILVTGANGLIGSAVTDCLIYMNEVLGYGIQIYAACRNIERMGIRFGDYFTRPYFHALFFDANRDFHYNNRVDYIIHAAGNAHPNILRQEPVETIISNIQGLYQLLEYCKECEVRRLLFISSSEIYGEIENSRLYREDTYGYVDGMNPRSCYPVSKRAAENLCVSYSTEYLCETVIVRPGHIYGPTQTGTDSRASAQFLRRAANGQDIILKSAGTQLRSYCYCLDCATAILTVLLKGCNKTAYNISFSDINVTIREFAERCASIGNVRTVFTRPDESETASYNAMSNSALVSDRLERLGWKGKWTVEKGIAKSIYYLKKGLYE